MEQAIANRDAATAAYREDVLTAFQDVEDNLAALRILAGRRERSTRTPCRVSGAVALVDRDDAVRGRRDDVSRGDHSAERRAGESDIAAVDILARRMTASVQLIKALGGGWKSS